MNRQEQIKEERTERIPFGVARKKLSIDAAAQKALSGRVPRWVNDIDARIADANAGGYEFIEGDVVAGNEKDRRVRKLVGKNKNGSPRYAYLMAIRKEFYEEDQAKKEEINMKVDAAIKGGNPDGLTHHGVNPHQGGAYVKNIEYQP